MDFTRALCRVHRLEGSLRAECLVSGAIFRPRGGRSQDIRCICSYAASTLRTHKGFFLPPCRRCKKMPSEWPFWRNLAVSCVYVFVTCLCKIFPLIDQELYKEKVSWKALREERFLAMAEKEGMSAKKVQAKLDSNKARMLVSSYCCNLIPYICKGTLRLFLGGCSEEGKAGSRLRANLR